MPKISRRLDSLTSFRTRTPTNEQTAANFTNMAFDYSRQKDVVPSGSAIVVGEVRGYRTMNPGEGGRPMALGVRGVGGNRVDVGGAPDHPGTRKF